MMSVSVPVSRKIVVGQPQLSRLEETLAELTLTGDQVGLFKAQPGRPKVLWYRQRGRSEGNPSLGVVTKAVRHPPVNTHLVMPGSLRRAGRNRPHSRQAAKSTCRERLGAGGRWIRTLGPPKGTKVVIEGRGPFTT